MNFQSSKLIGLIATLVVVSAGTSHVGTASAADPLKIVGPEGQSRVINKQYGPTTRTDTFWSIAQKMRPNQSVSIYQVMSAIYDANPHAFTGSNYNSLEKGMILSIPSADIIAKVNPAAARLRAQKNDEGWSAATKRVAPRVAAQASPAKPTPVKAQPKPAAIDNSAELKSLNEKVAALSAENERLRAQLLTAEENTASMGQFNESFKLKIAEFSQQILLLEESLASSQQENQILKQEIADINAQLEAQSAPVIEPASNIWRTLADNTLLLIGIAVSIALTLLAGVWMFIKRRDKKPEADTPVEQVAASTDETAQDTSVDDIPTETTSDEPQELEPPVTESLSDEIETNNDSETESEEDEGLSIQLDDDSEGLSVIPDDDSLDNLWDEDTAEDETALVIDEDIEAEIDALGATDLNVEDAIDKGIDSDDADMLAEDDAASLQEAESINDTVNEQTIDETVNELDTAIENTLDESNLEAELDAMAGEEVSHEQESLDAFDIDELTAQTEELEFDAVSLDETNLEQKITQEKVFEETSIEEAILEEPNLDDAIPASEIDDSETETVSLDETSLDETSLEKANLDEVEDFELQLNEAAEKAASNAAPEVAAGSTDEAMTLESGTVADETETSNAFFNDDPKDPFESDLAQASLNRPAMNDDLNLQEDNIEAQDIDAIPDANLESKVDNSNTLEWESTSQSDNASDSLLADDEFLLETDSQLTVDEALAALDAEESAAPAVAVSDDELDRFKSDNDFIDIDSLLTEADEEDAEVDRYKELDVDMGEIDSLMDNSGTVDVDDEENGINAKLDLARAYIEIEDEDSAIALLKEVEIDGNERQQQEAQSLRKELS